jgi:hypothetical protein
MDHESNLPPRLPTKQGQAPTSSPRTLNTNRQRLGGLFASLTLAGSPIKSRLAVESLLGTGEDEDQDDDEEDAPDAPGGVKGVVGGLVEWLTPTKGKSSGWMQDVSSGEKGDEAVRIPDSNPSGLESCGDRLSTLPAELYVPLLHTALSPRADFQAHRDHVLPTSNTSAAAYPLLGLVVLLPGIPVASLLGSSF